MNQAWPFHDEPNTACFTTTFVLEGSPILRVYHDFDGGWQFHGDDDQPATAEVARVVSLASMVTRDAALAQLRDLPYGWRATRSSVRAPWLLEKNNPYPTFAENGYYLEDALWLSQYRDDITPPPEETRDDLPPGTYVKLIFRFAAEDAERQDDETERMWVQITDRDEDENYVGELANDPHHAQVLACGDVVSFHPLHIMAVLEAE
ncbi:DUF2314 domain-containing protein [Anatilimnocola floriformis]|uniref:DUF2314 domain-containing protein n=1 Tax=Anatilimnocola floriformis TaxID=2948575 RepID=UPI0020C212A4|nr:DUF2314 domain-containing protein [Anatilimnocola floriformis]